MRYQSAKGSTFVFVIGKCIVAAHKSDDVSFHLSKNTPIIYCEAPWKYSEFCILFEIRNSFRQGILGYQKSTARKLSMEKSQLCVQPKLTLISMILR